MINMIKVVFIDGWAYEKCDGRRGKLRVNNTNIQ